MKKNKIDKRVKYPFYISDVGYMDKFIFETRKSAIEARCAAHMVSFRDGCKFKTKIRETDSGKFELTVERVE